MSYSHWENTSIQNANLKLAKPLHTHENTSTLIEYQSVWVLALNDKLNSIVRTLETWRQWEQEEEEEREEDEDKNKEGD